VTSTDLVPTGKTAAQVEAEKNLIPFKEGFDSRRKAGRGRPSKLDDPEYIVLFAQALAEGLTIPELADLFIIGQRTAREHKNNPLVRAAALKYIEERVIRITRKVDSQIEQRLQNVAVLDTATLLKIRKEFLGGVMRLQTQGGKDDPDTISAAQSQLEDNPELVAKLLDLVKQPAET
jgi:hypothetical protein